MLPLRFGRIVKSNGTRNIKILCICLLPSSVMQRTCSSVKMKGRELMDWFRAWANHPSRRTSGFVSIVYRTKQPCYCEPIIFIRMYFYKTMTDLCLISKYNENLNQRENFHAVASVRFDRNVLLEKSTSRKVFP